MHNKFVLLFLFFVSGHFLKAQSLPHNLRFQSLTLEDGLTDVQFNSFIFQDSKGFTWISSTDGLNRFDGLRVKSYKYKSGMNDTNIQSNFFEDKNGNLWFSTFETLNCYVRNLDSILTIPIMDKSGIPVKKNYKVFHLDQKKDRLWFRANNNIYGLNIKNTTEYFSLKVKTKGVNFSTQSDKDGNLNKIICSTWTNEPGVTFLYLKDTLVIESKKYFHQNSNCHKTIYLQDSKWLFISIDKLFIFDEKNPENIIPLSSPENTFFWDAVKIDEEHLFLSTNSKGILLYNWLTKTFINQWKQNKESPFYLSTNAPREIYLLNNYLWTSHLNRGIDYALLNKNYFENPFSKIDDFEKEVSSLVEDNENNIWVTTKQDGVYVFSKNGEFLFQKKGFIPKEESSNLKQITKDQEGNIFITTFKNIYYYDKIKEQFKVINKPKDLRFLFISTIYPNRKIVSTTKGLKEIFKNENNKYTINDCPEFLADSSFSFTELFQSSNGKVYIPYDGNELWVYNNTGKQLNLVKKIKADAQFFGFCESSNNRIWAGTSKGIVQINNDTIIQNILTGHPQLDDRNIYGIIEDHNRDLWISTNQGLWYFSPEEKLVFKYEEIDGLSGESFSNHFCNTISSNSEIWLGNNKGLVKFNPKKINPIDTPPKVYFNDLTINDKELIKGINELEKIELPYNRNTLAFDIAPISYYKSGETKIIYQLKGFDKKWLTTQNGQIIRFPNVPHGKYILKVKAEDVHGNQSEIKKLMIEITPPIWKTWWFYLLEVLAIFGLILFVYRIRINQIRRIAKKETDIAQLELEVVDQELKALRSQMNPHFLFNTMNSIKGIIIKKDVKKATEYLTKLSSLIRAILSNSEKKNISLSIELEALKLYMDLESLRFTKDFNYRIQVDKQIDQDFTRIPPLILQPFVENAIWHGLLPKTAGLNSLNINIFRLKDILICEIEDNGVGRKKAAEIQENKSHQSMGINITQKRIQLLHVENSIEIIDLVNQEEQPLGTKVIIKLFAPE